ncbi:MAG: regulatory protein RecX [Chloroflexi bacterium]|nr:regulatory protein RecX [Chloroflexota bacterium]
MRKAINFAERREERGAVDDPAVVLEAAARFLEARSRSVAEVRRRLGRAGYNAELIEGAIVRLGELGMLDDEAFGRAWVESRDRARPRGEIALRRELSLKGVDRSIVNDLLEERRAATEPDDVGLGRGPDFAAAERLLARNERALTRVSDPRQRRQRAYALLARNGFDPETCREAASGVMSGTRDSTVDESAVDEA